MVNHLREAFLGNMPDNYLGTFPRPKAGTLINLTEAQTALCPVMTTHGWIAPVERGAARLGVTTLFQVNNACWLAV